MDWLGELVVELAAFAQAYKSPPAPRVLAATPNRGIRGSTAIRKMDVAFVEGPGACDYHWKQVLVPGELKRNPDKDKSSGVDLVRYVREAFLAQDSRRFVLGFTLCGSLLRLWEFDRLGGIASIPVNIQEDGRHLVSVILGFLWMNDKELGFDPTITTEGKQRYITINQKGETEQLIVDKFMTRSGCIAGRATTSWTAYLERDSGREHPYVVKDSWQ